MSNNCCLIGRGKAYISDLNSGSSWGFDWGNSWGEPAAGFNAGQFLGNVTSLTITPQHSFRTRANVGGLIGGTDCAASVLESMQVSMTLNCHGTENLKQALYGRKSKVTTAAEDITDLYIPAPDGMFNAETLISFDRIGVDPDSVVLVDATTSQALERGRDFSASKTGITFLNAYPSDVLASYSYSSGFECVEAFTDSPKPMQLLIDGLNAADQADQFQVRIYKIRFSPLDSLTLVGDDFAEMTLTGIIEPNDSITDSSKSKFFTLKRVGA